MSLNKEIYFSKSFHQQGIPLLVSSRLLRKRGLGQIDISRLVKFQKSWRIEIAEVKSSELGERAFGRFQKQRLSGSLNFLTGIFGFSGCVAVLRNKPE